MPESIQNLLTMLQENGVQFALRILAAVAILVIGRVVAGIVRRVICRSMRRAKVDETLVRFTGNISFAAFMTFVVLAALAGLGVKTTSFIAVLGAAGLAVGLAMQGSLSNFAAGMLMIAFHPFKVGDFVEIAGVGGSVEEISIFNTRLKTPDNKVIIIPNAKITSDNIVNYSAEETRRIDLVFSIGYGDDIARARKLLEEILAAEERVLDDPAPTIGVLELGDSAVSIACRPWVKSPDYWGVRFDLLETVKARFDAEGISIPFPQTDVHLFRASA